MCVFIFAEQLFAVFVFVVVFVVVVVGGTSCTSCIHPHQDMTNLSLVAAIVVSHDSIFNKIGPMIVINGVMTPINGLINR